MKKIFFAAIMVMLCMPAFAKTTKKKKAPKKAAAGIQYVKINRTGCYGRCPIYTIQIDLTGLVTYTGISNVGDSGVYTKNLGATATKAIINRLNENKVDTCRNIYENMIPDLPGLVYTIKYRDSTKKINNASWGPQFLKQIAVDIEDIGKVHDATWKKGKK